MRTFGWTINILYFLEGYNLSKCEICGNEGATKLTWVVLWDSGVKRQVLRQVCKDCKKLVLVKE
jgi:ribosome-binding protein aMBF1 (putative translation factor)